MTTKELANLIAEHNEYCVREYQPQKLPHLTLEKALEFQSRMSHQLGHFGMWLDTVKCKEQTNEN